MIRGMVFMFFDDIESSCLIYILRGKNREKKKKNTVI